MNTLERIEERQSDSQPAHLLNSHEPRDSGRIIFVVDDERVIAFTLSAILRQHGYGTAWFSDPDSALQAAAILPPALLITDYNMLSMNGLCLAEAIQSICPSCPTLLISAQFALAHCALTAIRNDSNITLFAKPVRVKILLSCVAELLQRRLSVQLNHGLPVPERRPV